jgi:hypothetical protein
MIDEVAQTAALEEGDAPAVGMVCCPASTLCKPREAEGHVGWSVGIHAEQLAHGWR